MGDQSAPPWGMLVILVDMATKGKAASARSVRQSVTLPATLAADVRRVAKEKHVTMSRALVVLAEAEVPRAIADAFRSGNLGVMDYYKLRNVQADTSMREAIAKPPESPKS